MLLQVHQDQKTDAQMDTCTLRFVYIEIMSYFFTIKIESINLWYGQNLV